MARPLHELGEQHLRLALEATQTGLWTWDVATGKVSWSAECYAIHGLAEGDFDGTEDAFFALVHPEDRERVGSTVRAAIEARALYECEFRILRPGGEVAWVANRGRAVYEDGGPVRVLGTITVVTARKSAEEALQRYRLLSEHSRDILLFVRPTDGRIVEANSAATEAYGFAREELLARTLADLRPPSTRSEVPARMTEADAGGTTFETVHQRKDGTSFPVEVSSRGADVGGERLLLGIVRDIGARKQAEAALLAGEQRLRLAAEIAGVAIWEWHLPTNQVHWDAEAFRIHGMPPTPDGLVPYATWSSAVHPEDLPAQEDALRDMIRRGGRGQRAFRIRRASDGAERHIESVETVRLDEAGKAEWVVGTNIDVTERKRVQHELERSERFARSVVEASADCVKGLAPDGRLVWINESGRQLMEVASSDVLVGRDWAAFWEAGDVRAEAEAALAMARSGGVGRFRGFCPTAAGTPRWWDVAITPVMGPEGGLEQLLCVSRDVTEARAAEQALAESEQRFRIMADGLPFPLWVHDAEGRLRLVNRTYCEYFGVTEEQVFGENWQPLVHPDDAEAYVGSFLSAVARRVPWTGQCRVKRAAETEWRWVESFARPHHASDGTYLGMVGCSPDVTDRKHAEAALVRRERELQTLADNIPDIITRFDRDLRHVFVNAAVEKATGLSRAAFLGKTNRELGMPEALCAEWEAVLRAVFETGQERSITFTFPGPSEDRHYAARCVPELGPDGRVEHALSVTHDVTETKRHEQVLRDQDKRKDEFLATLAHELRNPLAPLRTGLQILRLDGESSAAATRTRQIMERQVGHLVDLVDDLLDLARVSQGKITLRAERLTAREVVEAAVEACRPTIEQKHHALTLDVPDGALVVEGDRTRLVQVVSNLLTNAAKYSEDGGRIEVAVRRDGGSAVVRVTDTGVGIAEQLLPTIWDMFTQVRDTMDKAQGGLGVGLSLVKKLVEMHGGSVAAESGGVGRGSAFTIRLPLVLSEPEAAVPAPPTSTRETSPGGHRILVVDDNADGAETMATMLDVLGYPTTIALTGEDALEAARRLRPGVVFCDIGLPEMDGYEVARRLRAAPETAETVLVALTGWGTESDKRRSKDAGFDLHLVKPVELAAVQKVLATLSPPAE